MKLSAVVQLIDGFSLQPAVGVAVRFLLNDKPYLPLSKAQAFYAFSDLDDGAYQLTILCENHVFFDQRIALQVPLREPLADAIIACTLAPSPLYPYPEGTTLIRGQIFQVDAQRRPVPGVDVAASYQNVRARPKRQTTRSSDYGRYDGRYALALTGKLAAHTAVDLNFSKAGFANVRKQLSVQPGTTQCVDIEIS
ncbi:peptidase associated/transthyretin-like domain-containing protein [Collimonas silvisoli]|uniref:carboxypeptidase regulatory-like domain-containing protein n=1 Tax=Collimonas silvisoli TaxID=2825884 RepID=UPI001B8B39B8|nr:carboxypeptidase regulatory-like domain-containing protein [Collimonas silvisoli]